MGVLDLILPRSCLSCGRERCDFLCDGCARALCWIRTGCTRCGLPTARPQRSCGDCRALDAAFAIARAPVTYEGPARDALKAFKLAGERRAARAMARMMLQATAGMDADVVTFVPSTTRAAVVRGFNPAHELARAITRLTGMRCDALLRKTRETADQAGLARADRRRNLAGAFSGMAPSGARTLPTPKAGVRGALDEPRAVLLVDDVLTTGATADACARALLAAGAKKVSVLTFARAV